MDFELSDEQRLIKNTAREFTDREIVERSRENARCRASFRKRTSLP